MPIRQALAEAGALLEGEFIIALKKKGNVASKYVNMDPVFTNPYLVDRLGVNLAEAFEWRFDAFAAPAVGGIPLLYATLRSTTGKDIRVAWADKQVDGSFAFERMGFAAAMRGRQVLVLEDVTTTGSSSKAVGTLVQQAGGEVVGYSCIWNRGGVTAEMMGASIHALVEEAIPAYKAEEHPQWGRWPLVEDIGHPDYFPDYPGPKIRLLA